jgi:hypothetical protein
MATTFSFNLEETSLEGLRNIQEEIRNEIERRKRLERGKLMENFKLAFRALQTAGIEVRYSDKYEGMDWCVDDWDSFYFN